MTQELEPFPIHRVGAVLTYFDLGSGGPCGQTMGADGSGYRCVLFEGHPADAEAQATAYLKSLHRNGRKTEEAVIVTNETGWGGNYVQFKPKEA